MRATLFGLTLTCLLLQGLPHSARAALGGSSASIETDRVAMNGLTRPAATGALQKQELQLPTGTVVTEYLTAKGAVYAVSWRGPAMPNLRQLLGNYFVNYQGAAQTAASKAGRQLSLQHIYRLEGGQEEGGIGTGQAADDQDKSQ